MGFFSNIGNALKTAVTKVAASPVGTALDYGTSIFAHPISTVKDLVTGNIKDITNTKNQFFTQPVGKQITQVVTGGATLAAAVVGAGAVSSAVKAGTALPAVTSAAKAVVNKIAESSVAHPIQTAAAVLVGAPLVAGVISKKPELVTSLPSSSFSSGQKLVDVIEKNPVAAGIVGSVTGGALLYEGAKAIGLVGGEKTSTPTAQPTFSTQPVTLTETPSVSKVIENPSLSAAPITPTLPQTTTPKASSGMVRRRKRKSKSSIPNISQRVNVIVSNKQAIQQNKKYIKREVLAY